jgi:tetratricopeptide (TPR) repeat protein
MFQLFSQHSFVEQHGSASHFQRVLREARNPLSLSAVLLKNIKYVIASRRPRFWNERGRALAARERYDEALACYDRALAIGGSIPQVLSNRGRVLLELDRPDEAEASLREAVRLKPDLASAYNNLSTVLDYSGRFEAAEASVRTALRLRPEDALAHANLGNILYHLGRTSESQASYRAALRLSPDVPGWRKGLSRPLLLAGQLEEGWKEFEWRWQTERGVHWRSLLPMPFWTGDAIGDRAILLFSDQGLGDTLQFCRYVPQIAATASKTVLAIQPSLVRLLSRLPGGSEMNPKDIGVDTWCALMSLPHAVGTTLETIPGTTPYLSADPADVARWRERLAGFDGLRIGVCWAGEGARNLSKIVKDRRRSITLGALARLGDVPGVRFFSLQKGPPAAEAANPPPAMQFHDFTEDLHDFADTAALIENLDLVISVDTAVAHLTGALDKPVWLLNRFDTDFRWLQDRDDSPWYPSLRQFRQPSPGDWMSVISRVREALQRLAGDHSELAPRSR